MAGQAFCRQEKHTLYTVVGSQRTKVEISLVKVQGLRSLVYDVMSGVVDLQGSVSVWFM